MASNALKEHKKKLAARKTKINALVKGIEEHELEREEAAQSRTNFADPKYAASAAKLSYAYSRNSSEDNDHDSYGRSTGSKPEDDISRMLESESDKKKKGKKKKSPGSAPAKKASPAPAPTDAPKKNKHIAISMPGTRRASPKGSRKLSTVTSTKVEPEPEVTKPAEIKLETRTSDVSISTDVEEDEESDEDEEGFLHIIEALHCFEKTKYIFMQRLLDYTEVETMGANFKKKDKVELTYQILNVDGQLLFLMQQQKIRCTGFIVYSKKSFQHILYDIYGNKVLKYIGPSVFMSRMTSKMLVTDAHDRILGYIKAFGTKVNYSVYNAIGERLFLVVSNLYIPTTSTDFTILCRGQKIGVIKYGWKHTFHDLNYIDYETSGIEFPEEMDEREKALLLGCLMLIEFFWYSPLTRLKLSLLFAGIFLLTLAIVILCIPLIIDNPDDDRKTKSYYIAEKLEDMPKHASGKKTTKG